MEIKSNTIISDIERVMIDSKIQLIKDKISYLADRHEYYMGLSTGSGSMATEIIEQKQAKLFKILDKLQEYEK